MTKICAKHLNLNKIKTKIIFFSVFEVVNWSVFSFQFGNITLSVLNCVSTFFIWCQFQQHFTAAFFLQKCFAQLFSIYVLAKKHFCTKNVIVKIDSRAQSFCLHHYVLNGLSYSGKETWLTLCICRRQLQKLGISGNP